MSQLLCPLSSVHCLWRWSIVVFFWLLATPTKASQKTAKAVTSLFPAIEALKYCEILPFPIWQGNVMSSSGLFCACASFCWSKASQARWLSQAHFILAKTYHTFSREGFHQNTSLVNNGHQNIYPASRSASKCHNASESCSRTPHPASAWAWAARGCTWLWFLFSNRMSKICWFHMHSYCNIQIGALSAPTSSRNFIRPLRHGPVGVL